MLRSIHQSWYRLCLCITACAGLVMCGGCPRSSHDERDVAQQEVMPANNQATVAEEKPDSPPASKLPQIPPPGPLVIQPEDDWLFVTDIEKDVEAGYATGSFDRTANRLTIETHAVTRFAIAIDRIPIDWYNVVAFRIDDRNSQLLPRAVPIIHVSRDGTGIWQVEEPPATPHRKNGG